MNVHNYTRAYFFSAYAYTWGRKTLQLWDAKIERRCTKDFPYTYKVTDMLLGEKLYVFGTSIVFAPLLAPMYILNDLNSFDVYMRGQKKEDYGLQSNVAPSFIEHVIS